MSSFMKLYWNEYGAYQHELRDGHCFNGSSSFWRVTAICLEDGLDWIGLLFGIASVLISCLAHIIIAVNITEYEEHKGCLLVFLVYLVDLPATLLSYQFITQILFSITSIILTIGVYILFKLNIPDIYRYRPRWKERSRRFSIICGAGFIVFIAILCNTIFILTIYISTSSQFINQGNYDKSRYTIGMVVGYLEVLFTFISAVLYIEQTSDKPKTIVVDIFYIISVLCSIRSLQHLYHAAPWVLSKCSSITGQVITAICRKQSKNKNSENKTRNITDEEDPHNLLCNETSSEDTYQESKTKLNDVNEGKSPGTTKLDAVKCAANEVQPFKNRRLGEIKESYYSNLYQVNTDSTTTSFTGDQDFENESLVEKQKMTRSNLNHRRSSFQLHLSLLATESKSERIAQWFETSTPEGEAPTFPHEERDKVTQHKDLFRVCDGFHEQ